MREFDRLKAQKDAISAKERERKMQQMNTQLIAAWHSRNTFPSGIRLDRAMLGRDWELFKAGWDAALSFFMPDAQCDACHKPLKLPNELCEDCRGYCDCRSAR
jgi:hypothetical protein